MHDLPYVPAAAPVPVCAVVRGERQDDARVLGWRGERVYLSWRTGPGLNHLGWVPAADVERRDAGVMTR